MRYLQIYINNNDNINNNNINNIDNIDNVNNIINECTICLETNTTTSDIILMQTYNNSISYNCINYKYFLYGYWNCKCNGYLHKHCLKKWLAIDESCPICRMTTNKVTIYKFFDILKYIFFIIINLLFIFGVISNLFIVWYVLTHI